MGLGEQDGGFDRGVGQIRIVGHNLLETIAMLQTRRQRMGRDARAADHREPAFDVGVGLDPDGARFGVTDRALDRRARRLADLGDDGRRQFDARGSDVCGGDGFQGAHEPFLGGEAEQDVAGQAIHQTGVSDAFQAQKPPLDTAERDRPGLGVDSEHLVFDRLFDGALWRPGELGDLARGQANRGGYGALL